MRRVWLFFVLLNFLMANITSVIMVSTTNAISGTVVISKVMADDATSADSEVIEINNISNSDVDITGWSIFYIASTNNMSKLLTISTSDLKHRVLLPAGASESFISVKYSEKHPSSDNYLSATKFNGGIASSSAGLELRDNKGLAVDTVRWGAWSPDIDATPAPSLAKQNGNYWYLKRVNSDTDNNQSDFVLLSQAGMNISYGNLYEVVDLCTNLPGIQIEVPDDMELSGDACVPKLMIADLSLSELLPNPSGVDTGNEWLEVYNNSDFEVRLDDYYLSIGGKKVVFPTGSEVKAREYKVFSDTELGVVFANKIGLSINLLARTNQLIDTMPSYVDAPVDMAWAIVDGSWQYTNQPTPGGSNKPSLVEIDLVDPETKLVICKEGYYLNPATNRCNKIKAEEVPSACKPNQYRSEETGRCRNYVTVATPAPCKDGQYRSEETGRCRSIALAASAVLKSCADDQFRNPATGRCKKIASVEDIKPCKDGWERNPETNRCRKNALSNIPVTNFAVEPIGMSKTSIGVWLTVAGLMLAGLAYLAWEWRHEVVGKIVELRQRISRR